MKTVRAVSKSETFTLVFQILSAISGFLSIAILLFSLSLEAQQIIPNSEPFEDDTFTKFVEKLTYVTHLPLIEKQGLTRGFSGGEPWSGSYWPTYRGLLGNRYASSTFAKSKRFLDNYQSIQSFPASSLVASGRVSELSPSEKYDLLVGDSSWALTRFMWEKGFRALQQNGVVASWTGICHGWAAAASMDTTSPYSAVTVTDVTGRYNVTFYANDIKALLSFLWAESAPSAFRAGNRCRKYHVPTDSYDRPTDRPCLDTNPMTWHLALVNRVGIKRLSLVMDASSGTEVWNYPITGYDYHYFDPKTYAPTMDLESSVRPLSEIPNDRFRSYRSPKAKFLVGIMMDTYHPALTQPSRGNTNHIVTSKKTFIYDLELDETYNVVGGEWYSHETPDFIWSFATGSRAGTREDVRLMADEQDWDASRKMSDSVAAMARQASQRGEVLSSIVDALLNSSKKAEPEPTPEEERNVEEEISP
ncbi:MAG: hypothetical protein ACK5Y2_08730 [Bdellovibrionales bacterium]